MKLSLKQKIAVNRIRRWKAEQKKKNELCKRAVKPIPSYIANRKLT